MRWVEEHSEAEGLTLIDGVLTHWEKMHETPTPELEMSKRYLELAHTVIGRNATLGSPVHR